MTAEPMPDPTTQAVTFLRHLWPDAEGQGYLVLWWRDTHHTEFVTLANIDTEVPRLLVERGDVNVYFGLGLQPRRLNNQQRGLQADVVAIPGIWLDLDTMAGHSGGNGKVYPPDKDAARTILDGLPARPCWLIDSGNGLHAYWIFREPWTLDHQAERLAAQRASKGWEVLARKAAATKGWTVDACADLARVMRLPGTVNRKEGLPDALCVVLEQSGKEPTLNPSDFAEWAPEGVEVGIELHREPLIGGDFTIRNGASVPDAVTLLRDYDPGNFDKTWRRLRQATGPKSLGDLSSSGYELSLCTQVVNSQLEVDNQTLVDMCAAFRRLTDPTGKQAMDKGVKYYEDLLRKARNGKGYSDNAVVKSALAEQVAREKDEEVVQAVEEGTQIDLLRKAIPRDPAGKAIGNLDGLERIVKRGTTDARYYLVINGTEVLVGGLKDLQDWKKFRTYLGDQLNRLIGPVNRKANEWDRLVDTMLTICEKEELGEDGEGWEMFQDAIEDYVRSTMPGPRPGEPIIQRHAVPRRLPWVHKGELGISRPDFARWLDREDRTRRDPKEVQSYLRRLLGASRDVTVNPYRDLKRRGDGTMNRSYYVGAIPGFLADLTPDGEGCEDE